MNNVLEQWYRYGTSYYHLIRGRLVLFDRFVYDSPARTHAKRSLKSRARGWSLRAAAPVAETPPSLSLEAVERQTIQRALATHAGNKRAAATALGIAYSTLFEKIRKYGLQA